MSKRKLDRLVFLLLLATQAISQSLYQPGDWVSYRDFRYAVSVDAGTRDVYFATTGGILSYDILKQKWYEPMVVGYGFSESVRIENPQLILFDDNTNFLWVSTPSELLQYNALNDSWRRVENNLWPPTERVVNIGVGGNSIYLETIPASLYSLLFNSGTPIPAPEWQEHITRYKGTRNFGGFMVDNASTIEPETRWRGLRSKVWPDEDKFPIQTLPQGYVLKFNGTVLDKDLYEYPVTDWITDHWGTLWSCHWGIGILKSDTRNFRSEIFLQGPAGNNLRAFALVHGKYWMGGDNQGDNLGISRASSPNLLEWNRTATRDDSKILSTRVTDFSSADQSIFVATMDGLLQYRFPREKWELYTVKQGLQNNEIRALAATPFELWIGTSQGLCVMSKQDQKIVRIESQELLSINDLAFCNDTLFIATDYGWYHGAVKDRVFTFFDILPGISARRVLKLFAYKSEIWAATDLGIMVYDTKTQKAQSWLADVWMKKQQPTCITADEKFVWIGTNNGFYRYNKESHEWVQFTTADGLLDNRVQYLAVMGDDLFICTPTGLTRYYWNNPARIK